MYCKSLKMVRLSLETSPDVYPTSCVTKEYDMLHISKEERSIIAKLTQMKAKNLSDKELQRAFSGAATLICVRLAKRMIREGKLTLATIQEAPEDQVQRLREAKQEAKRIAHQFLKGATQS